MVVGPVVAATAWLALQLHRANLLGNAVRVTPESLPELHAVLDEVRNRLAYHRRVDVYVTDRVSGLMSLTSLFGTRIIMIEGDLAATLLSDGRRAELTFLVARFIGALKSERDRIGLATAGDLDAALMAFAERHAPGQRAAMVAAMGVDLPARTPVDYYRYEDDRALQSAFGAFVRGTHDTGRPKRYPGGRLACWKVKGASWMAWTDDERRHGAGRALALVAARVRTNLSLK